MPAIRWWEEPAGRTAARSEDGTVTLRHVYTVVCDRPEDGPVVAVDKVAEAYGLWYSPHPRYPAAVLKAFDCQHKPGSDRHFQVTAVYDSKRLPGRPADPPTAALPNAPASPSPGQSDASPATARPPKFSITKRDEKEAVRLDRNGDPIENSAGDPLEGVEVNRPVLLLNVSWFSTNVTLAHCFGFWDKVNAADWNGFPRRTLKVEDFSFDDTYDLVPGAGPGGPAGYGLVREVKLVLAYKRGPTGGLAEPRGWQPRFLDAGKRERVAGKLVEIKEEKTGQPLSDPHPLNGAGLRWTPGQDFHYVDVDLYEEADFGGLIV
jgi:hypothetical protein